MTTESAANREGGSLDGVVSQRDGLEIAIIGLASVYPEDALKVFTTDEITAMGKRHEHLADYECFELLKAALTNAKLTCGERSEPLGEAHGSAPNKEER